MHPRTCLNPSSIPRGHVFALSLIVAGLCALATEASAQAAREDTPLRVRMKASEPGTGSAAREGAVRNAQQAVLVQVLESIVGEESWATVAPLLEDPSRFVHSTRMLDHSETDGVTTVEVETLVRAADLRVEAARVLLRRLSSFPRILILEAERIRPEAPFALSKEGTTTRVLRKAFEKHRIPVVGADSLLERYSDAELLERIRGDLATASRFAHENLVDAVILAEAVAEPERLAERRRTYRVNAKVSVRVFRARDGKLLKAIARESVIQGADPEEVGVQAVKDACAKLRDDVLVTVILMAVDTTPRGGVTLTIENVGAPARFEAIMQFLRDSFGEQSLDKLYYTEVEARLGVAYSGPMAPFVDQLTEHGYPGFHLEARQVIEHDMTVCVVE